jgi:hypothetical protein
MRQLDFRTVKFYYRFPWINILDCISLLSEDKDEAGGCLGEAKQMFGTRILGSNTELDHSNIRGGVFFFFFKEEGVRPFPTVLVVVKWSDSYSNSSNLLMRSYTKKFPHRILRERIDRAQLKRTVGLGS